MSNRNPLARRVFTEALTKPFLRGLVFPTFVLLLLISQADAAIAWHLLPRDFAQVSPLARTIILIGLTTAWSLTVANALRPVWRQPVIGWLIRQPCGAWQWIRHAWQPFAVALIPIAAVWWIGSYGAAPVLHYAGFVPLALPVMLSASTSGARASFFTAAAVALSAVLTFFYWRFPGLALFGLLLAPALAAVGLALVRRQPARGAQRRTSLCNGTSVIGALVLRDLRAILRTRRAAAWETLGLATLASLMMFALRVNGAIAGRDALLAAAVLFALAMLPVYGNFERARARLGRELARAHWPVSARERAVALFLLALLFLLPAALPLALLGATMGAANLAAFTCFVATAAALTTALFARMLNTPASAIGWFLNSVLFQTVLLGTAPPWCYPIAALVLCAVCARLSVAGVQRFMNA